MDIPNQPTKIRLRYLTSVSPDVLYTVINKLVKFYTTPEEK